MRSPTNHARRTLTTLVITALIVATGSLQAQSVLTGFGPSSSPNSSELEPRVHQSTKFCGKKWLKQARQLPDEQLRWMLQQSHGIYSYGAGDRTAMTLEMLSTPSFRDCDVRRHWDKRETTMRVTYLLPDGTRAIQLVNFAKDEIFFNQRPRVYAGIGKALLSGVTADGNTTSRWVSLPRLAEAMSGLQARQQPVSATVIATVGLGGAAAVVSPN